MSIKMARAKLRKAGAGVGVEKSNWKLSEFYTETLDLYQEISSDERACRTQVLLLLHSIRDGILSLKYRI